MSKENSTGKILISRRNLFKGAGALAGLAVIGNLNVPGVTVASPNEDGTATASCEIKLGFKIIADQLPIVGQCTTNEAYGPNGDSLQSTTGVDGKGGLLAWRKSDNWTAYTNGYETWVNGPNGIQKRLNTERFSWENDPIVAPTIPVETPKTYNFPPIPVSGRSDEALKILLNNIPWENRPGSFGMAVGKYEDISIVDGQKIKVRITTNHSTSEVTEIVLEPGDKGHNVNFFVNGFGSDKNFWTETHSADETVAAVKKYLRSGDPVMLRYSADGSLRGDYPYPFNAEFNGWR